MPVPIGDVCLLFGQAVLERRWQERPRAAGHWASDGAVARLRLPGVAAVEALLPALAGWGLRLDEGDEPGALAVVGTSGFLWPSRRFELGRVAGAGGRPVLAARLAGSDDRALAAPEPGEPPLPEPGELLPTERPLSWLRREPRADVFADRFTGEEVRVERSAPPVALSIACARGPVAVLAEQAITDLEQQLGLMFRAALPPDRGMLFDFGQPGPRGFWMRNTLVPLDLLFLDEQGGVRALVERARPLSLRHRGTRRRCRFVLEVAGGFAAAHGVAEGDRVRWPHSG